MDLRLVFGSGFVEDNDHIVAAVIGSEAALGQK